jgi:hypothetical protein
MTHAQCGIVPKKTTFVTPQTAHHGGLRTVSYTGPGLRLVTEWDEERQEPLVGLWRVSFTDPSQNYSDTAYIAYHSDFTEFQNSERVPSIGAICQGVWERTGRFTYRVNHYALAYGDSQKLTNVIRIREYITMNEPRKTFTGEFIQDVYDTAHHLLATFKGPMTGKRVTIDSDIDSQ